MNDFNGGKIIVRIVAPINYNVPNDVDIIEVDTTSGGLTTINLQKITPGDTRKPVYISDVSNNASVGNIFVKATGGNLINNAGQIDLKVNGIIAEVIIADTKRFIANLSTDDSSVTTNGHTIQDEGVSLPQRQNLNFTGAQVVVTDDPLNNGTKVDITGNGHTIQDEGVNLPQRQNLNFKGNGVLVTDNAGTNSSDVSINVSPLANLVYVAKNGNDTTGDGSIAFPFLTIQKGINVAYTQQSLSPMTRPIVMVGPGTYTENCTLKANVFVRGVGINDTRVSGNWVIDNTFTPAGDWRSGFIDIGIFGNFTADFNAFSSNEGKIFVTNTRITGAITLTAFSSINQFIWFGGEFFGLITLNGMNTQLSAVIDQSTNGIVLTSNVNSDTLLTTIGGVISNINASVTIDRSFVLELSHAIKPTSTLTLGNTTLNLSRPSVSANINSVPLASKLVFTGNAKRDNIIIINPVTPSFDIPNWADEKQFVSVTNFDTGSLPVGWSGQVIGTGSSVVYTQVTESGVSPGLALATITTTAAARVSLVTGSGYQYMRSFIDGPESTCFIQMRWSGIPSASQSTLLMGWINSNTFTPPNTLGNTLAIVYDPSNVTGCNPGLITNLFLLARSNYNGPVANTVVDLGITYDAVNWRAYKITYDNVLNEVRVYRDNVLLTTLTNLANVPAGLTRGVIPAAASGGLQGGFYLGNGSVVAPSGSAIRVAKFSVFKRYS